jgi:Flp pilus assembly protein TadB
VGQWQRLSENPLPWLLELLLLLVLLLLLPLLLLLLLYQLLLALLLQQVLLILRMRSHCREKPKSNNPQLHDALQIWFWVFVNLG